MPITIPYFPTEMATYLMDTYCLIEPRYCNKEAVVADITDILTDLIGILPPHDGGNAIVLYDTLTAPINKILDILDGLRPEAHEIYLANDGDYSRATEVRLDLSEWAHHHRTS